MPDFQGQLSPCMSSIVFETRAHDRWILTAEHPSVASQDGVQGLSSDSVRINCYLRQYLYEVLTAKPNISEIAGTKGAWFAGNNNAKDEST